jgi:hypothetical protein
METLIRLNKLTPNLPIGFINKNGCMYSFHSLLYVQYKIDATLLTYINRQD